MSSRGITFANDWVQENVNLEAYDPPHEVIREHVERMLSDAAAEGISRDEIEEDMDDLHNFISEAFQNRTDDEVERLASKDD